MGHEVKRRQKRQQAMVDEKCKKGECIRELSLNASIVFSQRESFVLIIRVSAWGKLEAHRGADFTHLIEANPAAAGARVHAPWARSYTPSTQNSSCKPLPLPL